MSNIYRDLFLRVISELWVEYLTQMEALRVAIGLEAYAQRDPLVQYKTRGFEMFQRLMEDMRVGVVNRIFTFQPRNLDRIQAGFDESPIIKKLIDHSIDRHVTNDQTTHNGEVWFHFGSDFQVQ